MLYLTTDENEYCVLRLLLNGALECEAHADIDTAPSDNVAASCAFTKPLSAGWDPPIFKLLFLFTQAAVFISR